MSSEKKNIKEEESNESIEFLKEWLRISKIHGLDRVVLSKKLPLRVIWIVGLLCSAGLCSFLIARIIMDFLRYEVKSHIREIYPKEVPFPRIVLCNLNPMVTPQANQYIRDYFAKTFKLKANKYADLYDHGINPDKELNYLFYTTNYPNVNETLKRSFGYDFIVYCTYYYDSCTSDDIIPYYDTTSGNCYIINSSKYPNGSERRPYQSYIQDYGLRLLIYTGPPENETNYMFNPSSGKKGIKIRVEDPEYDGVVLGGQQIAPGNHVQIIVNRIETKNMPSPYSNCMAAESVDTPAAEQIKKMGLKYTRKTCLYVCGQMNNLITVGCNSFTYPVIPNTPLCTTRGQYEQLSKIGLNLTSCDEMCPIECDSVTYETSTSNAIWPNYNSYYAAIRSKLFRDLFGDDEDMSYETVKQSFVAATIIYANIKYTEISETPNMMLVDLVAAIGGMMGLFLGMSIVCLIEIVELGFEMFMVFLKKTQSKNKSFVNKNNQKLASNSVDIDPNH